MNNLYRTYMTRRIMGALVLVLVIGGFSWVLSSKLLTVVLNRPQAAFVPAQQLRTNLSAAQLYSSACTFVVSFVVSGIVL